MIHSPRVRICYRACGRRLQASCSSSTSLVSCPSLRHQHEIRGSKLSRYTHTQGSLNAHLEPSQCRRGAPKASGTASRACCLTEPSGGRLRIHYVPCRIWPLGACRSVACITPRALQPSQNEKPRHQLHTKLHCQPDVWFGRTGRLNLLTHQPCAGSVPSAPAVQIGRAHV